MSNKKSGFTIMELMMAMAFLSFILVFVVSATIQMFQISNKGGVMKQINQSGRSIMDEMARSLRGQNANAITYVPADNRLCASSVAYVWNTVQGTGNNNRFTDNSVINFVRIDDPAQAAIACTRSGGNLPAIDETKAVRLTSEQVGVVRLAAERNVATNANSKLIKLHLELATNTDGNRPVLNGSVYQCPAGANGQFCAQSVFETIVYAPNTR